MIDTHRRPTFTPIRYSKHRCTYTIPYCKVGSPEVALQETLRLIGLDGKIPPKPKRKPVIKKAKVIKVAKVVKVPRKPMVPLKRPTITLEEVSDIILDVIDTTT